MFLYVHPLGCTLYVVLRLQESVCQKDKEKNRRTRTAEIVSGGNRIQCVTIRAQKPILLISTYMPCKGVSDNYEAFSDCLDQLNEIYY